MKKVTIWVFAVILLSGLAQAKSQPESPPAIDIGAAASQGDTETIRLYAARGEDISAQQPGGGGETALQLSAVFGQIDAAAVLIELGADVNARSRDGSTPLHSAAYFGRTGIVKLLLENGARPDLQNGRFETPLDTVAPEWNSELAGSYRYIKGTYGIPLEVAEVKASRPKIADMIRRYAPSGPASKGEGRKVWRYPSILQRDIAIWSDGTRLSGVLLYPKGRNKGIKLPAIVLCQGWGGRKADSLGTGIGPRFAAAGYVVLAFDYRSWGDSDNRLVVRGEMPKLEKDGYVTVRAQAIRELVDPFDQQEDIDAAISYIHGEPMVDKNRIGIWGTSFGAGHVIYRAGNDRRIACVVAQVGGMADDWTERYPQGLNRIYKMKAARARGQIDPVPQGEKASPELRGSPHPERQALFFPGKYVEQIRVPTLLIDAGREHYYDIRENSDRVLGILRKNGVPTEYHVIEGIGHYDIYGGKPLDEAMKLEIAWFDKHLKGKD